MGVLNAETVTAASESFELLYDGGFKGVDPQWGDIAMEAPSTGAGNNYVWLGEIPQLKELIGELEIRDLAVNDYYLKNRKFALAIGVPADHFADDTLGTFNPVMRNMGGQAARFPDKLVFQLLVDGFTAKGFDGVPFFSENHPGGPNGGTFSNKGTAPLTASSYNEAIAQMMALKDKHGEPIGLTNFTLAVGPALREKGLSILKAERVDGGNTNINRNSAELVISARLAATPTAWFIIADMDGLKPFIFQLREAPKFTAKDQLDDDNMFFEEKAIYKVSMRCNAGYALAQLAFGSTGQG